jgi:hypothetical protein
MEEEKLEELEVQEVFNEDSIEVLCEDAEIENQEEIEVIDNANENE